jgi:sulfhydrogenase subunit alpha
VGKTVVVEHLARVEGHGGITVELDGGRVRTVHFNVFEGIRLLEGLIRGRSYEEVSFITSRICAICSTAHALTALKAIEAAFGVETTPQTDSLRDLMFRGENIESHALHLFLLAAPDYLGYPNAVAMAASHREAVAVGLRLKKLGNTIQEVVGGRAIHPVNAVVGGFGRPPPVDELLGLERNLKEGLGDCEAALDFLRSLPAADFCAADTTFAALGASGGFGYYRGDEVVVHKGGTASRLPVSSYPSLTNEETVPHSHAKHSSLDGEPLMVGALARLTVNSDGLSEIARRAMDDLGLVLPSANPMDNNKAQAVELVHDVARSLQCVSQMLEEGLEWEEPSRAEPKAGTGWAATEAPRGLLFYSLSFDDEGCVTGADVVTPTAINARSLEGHLRQTVEQAGNLELDAQRKHLEMIARAYDPCISCSVHLVQKR